MRGFCRLANGVPTSFTFPVGAHGPKPAFDRVVDYFEESNLPFAMNMVEPEMFEMIERWYPGQYQIEYDRDSADYLYRQESLATLAGKKLHAKRADQWEKLAGVPGVRTGMGQRE